MSLNQSSVDEIRKRFDNDVERFANLETGQSSTMDAPLTIDVITKAAAVVTPHATDVLDVGCGAGNLSIKLLQMLPDAKVTLVDLSQPMLERATDRLQSVGAVTTTAMQVDIREAEFEDESFDIITAAAVLHHLRNTNEWSHVFQQFFRWLRPGGSVWISDLVNQTLRPVQELMWQRYGDYLVNIKDEKYRDHVFDYIAKEDSPESLMFQLDLLREAGFQHREVLHKNAVFAAFGAVKS